MNMRKFKTDERLNKIIAAASSRQPSLRVIIENIHDPHNVSAIFRTCDAVGVQNIGLLYNKESFPKISRISSASANKWIDTEKDTNVKEYIHKLKNDGFTIYASLLNKDSLNLYDIDLTKKVALVFGNEHRGISEEMIKYADETFYIPMHGMIQSLNVSVAAAVSLYEAQRQRVIKGLYPNTEMPKEELEIIIDKWCNK